MSETRKDAERRDGLDSADRGYRNGEPADIAAGQKTPGKKKGRGWLAALCVVVLIAAGVTIYWELTTKPPETVEAELPGKEENPVRVERYYTLLVVGDDQEGGNTDTIMLLRFDTAEMKVNVLSIPRDTLINSSLGNKKINAVYHNLDGIDSLLDAVRELTGYRPNNYMVVNTSVFTDVVDAMDGVDFYVPFDMDYDDYSNFDENGVARYVFTIHVTEGQQTLSGYDALGVFRWRQNNNSSGHVYLNPDIERIDMQHELLMAIAEKAMNTKNVLTLTDIAKAVLNQCQTDLSIGNIQWYIEQFLKMSMDSLEFFTMPTSGAWIKKAAYVTINVDAWIEMLNANFKITDRELTREDCGIVYVASPKDLVDGQLYVDPDELASTNGAAVDQYFVGP
ncbi:MAG: LCP family protein [Oscillospiraceae bacterium]|nr:LCP family protein [Oscillospiraceae bacterium]